MHGQMLDTVLPLKDSIAHIGLRKEIPFIGSNSILGRAVVVNANPDDLEA